MHPGVEGGLSHGPGHGRVADQPQRRRNAEVMEYFSGLLGGRALPPTASGRTVSKVLAKEFRAGELEKSLVGVKLNSSSAVCDGYPFPYPSPVRAARGEGT